ncbi:hypothetical protein QWY85_13545 [Neolewinella lacunae]|uniref:Effector-associated domain-containing protein n=1 Tax=Neolewinella lacunae TaxID=1517758 RepID=A0A923T760_9BACT|nr:hypothetical protein [Neolewinella lacunae]MBC6993266.1 hypothetical protein [Neolewinella lacunae]MDN3635687.1 hypothetical protein [Neolewinella lacunae]
MYDNIRDLIRDNRLEEALVAMEGIELSTHPENDLASQLIILQRRWRSLQDKMIGNLAEDRLIAIEESQLVQDMLTLLRRAESPAFRHEKTPSGDGSKSVRDAGQIRPSEPQRGDRKARRPRWPYLAAGVLLLALLAWAVLPRNEKPTQASTTAQETPVQEEPKDATLPPADPAKEPGRTQEPDPSPGTGTTPVRPGGVLINPELLDRVQLDPGLVRDTRIRQLIKPLMTDGPQVDIAVAYYQGKASTTSYNSTQAQAFASYLDKELKANVGTEVLTDAFHDHEDRERLQLRGAFTDARLKTKRAKYLLLVDLRNETLLGKADYRLCVYDVARQKGFTRGASVNLKSVGAIKEMLNKAQAFVTELEERGIVVY